MAEGLCGYRSGIPMRPMNWTLMPVCSNRRPSLGLTVTAPFTDSPSMYSGAFSRLFLSSLTSTVCRSSASSRTMSISTGVEKKKEDMTLTPSDWALQEALSIRSSTVACVRLACYSQRCWTRRKALLWHLRLAALACQESYPATLMGCCLNNLQADNVLYRLSSSPLSCLF
jgi:hypothetical protein